MDSEDAHPAGQVAQHLANRYGISVAGFHPHPGENYRYEGHLPDQSQLPQFDLDVHIKGKGGGVAQLALLAALLTWPTENRSALAPRIRDGYFPSESALNYLFHLIISQPGWPNEINLAEIETQIPNYGPLLYGRPTNESELSDLFFTWAQVLALRPTHIHIEIALEILEHQLAIKDESWNEQLQRGANESGVSLAGFHPHPGENYRYQGQSPDKSQLPLLEIEAVLAGSILQWPAVSLIVMAALVKGSGPARIALLARVPRKYFSSILDRLIFDSICSSIDERGDIHLNRIRAQILEKIRAAYHDEATQAWKLDDAMFTWAQVLDLSPTPSQAARAIEMQEQIAIEAGYLEDEDD